MSSLRVYVDTSVFGGVYDAEFELASRRFFEQVLQDVPQSPGGRS